MLPSHTPPLPSVTPPPILQVLLRPVRIFKDPFRGAPHLLVLAECIDPAGKPIPTNTRHAANKTFDAKLDEEPWWGAF